jgi:hypothetical protein
MEVHTYSPSPHNWENEVLKPAEATLKDPDSKKKPKKTKT